MSTPTIIRHKLTAEGFAVVVTYFERTGMDAAVQQYHTNGETTQLYLAHSMPWSTEAAAILAFGEIE